MLIMALCAAGVSLLFGIISLFGDQLKIGQRSSNGGATSPSPAASPIASPTQPVTEVELLTGGLDPQKIVSESLTIEPKSFQAFRFEIPERPGTPRVRGEITASGGGRDDIYLLILDDSGLEDYRDGKGYSSYLESRVTDTKKISLTLPPGTYHAVLSNKHARFYPKRVRADLTLTYE